MLHLGADDFHELVGGVVAVGGGDAILVRFAQLAAAHPGGGRYTAIAAGGLHQAALLVVFIGSGAEQQPLCAVPDAFLLEGDGVICCDELLRAAALPGHEGTGSLRGGGVQVHSAVGGGGCVFMQRLHPGGILTELRLARSVGIGGGFAEHFLNGYLLVAYACRVGAGGGALRLG